MPHGVQAQTLVALALEALLQRRVELANALPRVALQPVEDLSRDGLVLVEIALPDLLDRKLVHTCHRF